MNVFTMILLFISGKHWVELNGSDLSSLKQISAAIESKCEGGGEKLNKAMNHTISCNTESETLCSQIANHSLHCLEPVVKVLQECLPDEKKTIVPLFENMIISSFNYICKATGEQILEFANPCIGSLFHECGAELSYVHKAFTRVLTAKVFCANLQSAKDCLHLKIAKGCKNEHSKMFYDGFLNSAVEPCLKIN